MSDCSVVPAWPHTLTPTPWYRWRGRTSGGWADFWQKMSCGKFYVKQILKADDYEAALAVLSESAGMFVIYSIILFFAVTTAFEDLRHVNCKLGGGWETIGDGKGNWCMFYYFFIFLCVEWLCVRHLWLTQTRLLISDMLQTAFYFSIIFIVRFVTCIFTSKIKKTCKTLYIAYVLCCKVSSRMSECQLG